MLYEERLEAAEQRRMEGNELYAQSDFDGCLAKYVLGLNYFSEDFMMQVCCWLCRVMPADGCQHFNTLPVQQLEGTFYDQANEIRTRLLLNMAAVKLKLESYHDAASCCTEVGHNSHCIVLCNTQRMDKIVTNNTLSTFAGVKA